MRGIAGISSDPRAPRVGTVRTYDPYRKTYVVGVESIGDKTCRAMRTGLDKPLAAGSSCLVMPVVGRNWVIIGELDLVSREPDKQLPDSGEQEAAVAGQLSAAVSQRESVHTPNYRPLDLQGVGEEPQFSGDAGLENRTTDHIRRSRVKIYSFGDILLRASAICFTLFHKAENAIYRRCRSEFFEALGVVLSVFTPVDGVNAGKSTRRLVVRHDPASPDVVDKIRSEGQLTALDAIEGDGLFSGPVANRGERAIWGTHRVEEIDNDVGALRGEQLFGDGTGYQYQVGDFAAENGPHPVTGVQNPRTPNGVRTPAASAGYGASADAQVSAGIHAMLGEHLELTANSASGEVELKNTASGGVHRVIMRENMLLMETGGQFFRLDAAGLEISVKSVKITSSGSTDLASAGSMTIAAASVDYQVS